MPMAPLPTIPVLTSKTTLVAKVNLDEAFIDFWANSLLDPVLKHWPCFVICQLKPLPPASTSASPTPTWLVIEQRLTCVVPAAPPAMEEAEVTIPPAHPCALKQLNQGAALAPMMVGATVFTVASTMTASVAATQENITQQPKDDSLPIGTAETAPSALASVSAPKADKTVKDELPHSATAQNGLAHDDEGQYERKFETVAPAGCANEEPSFQTNT
ncbi:hypothetical protein V8E52_006538 [Russula decolorans]